jgi:hypothetical protein
MVSMSLYELSPYNVYCGSQPPYLWLRAALKAKSL